MAPAQSKTVNSSAISWPTCSAPTPPGKRPRRRSSRARRPAGAVAERQPGSNQHQEARFIALAKPKRRACNATATIRFTSSTSTSVNATRRQRPQRGRCAAASADAVGSAAAAADADARGNGQRGAAGFGIRVIHSGVWGFASSPIVTEDEIRRIARNRSRRRESERRRQEDRRQARAGCARTRTTGRRRCSNDPNSVPQDQKQAFVQKVVDAVVKNKDVTSVNRLGAADERVEVLRLERRVVHRAGNVGGRTRRFNVTRAEGRRVARTRNYIGVPKTGGWEVVEDGEMLDSAERDRRRGGRDDAPPNRSSLGLKDLDPDAVARDADRFTRSSPTRRSSIGSSATKRTTPAPAS